MNNREKFLEHIQNLNDSYSESHKSTDELKSLNEIFNNYVTELNRDIENLNNNVTFSFIEIIDNDNSNQFMIFGRVLGFVNLINGNIAVEVNSNNGKNEIIDIVINKENKLFSTLYNKVIEGNEDEVIAGLLYSLRR